MHAAVERRKGERGRQGSGGGVRGRGLELSERDGPMLRLVGEQYAVTVEQLARMIGRTHHTARWVCGRWRRAGWIESRPLAHRGPSFLWLTTRGIRAADSPYRSWRPNVSLAAHIEAVTDTRLLLERNLRLGSWVCERELARRFPSRSRERSHLPDGLLVTDQSEIAVEVELSLKSRSRLDRIIDDLGRRYDQVWYFAPPPLQPVLKSLAAEASWRNVIVFGYPARPGELPL